MYDVIQSTNASKWSLNHKYGQNVISSEQRRLNWFFYFYRKWGISREKTDVPASSVRYLIVYNS